MNKALDLYEDIYGQWRTYYELWRFNYLDDKIKDAQKFSEKLVRLQPEYPQSYIAYLISHQKGSQTIDDYSLLGFTKAYNAAKKACT